MLPGGRLLCVITEILPKRLTIPEIGARAPHHQPSDVPEPYTGGCPLQPLPGVVCLGASYPHSATDPALAIPGNHSSPSMVSCKTLVV